MCLISVTSTYVNKNVQSTETQIMGVHCTQVSSGDE